MSKETIIGITGSFGAGKGELADYLVKNKDFIHFSVSSYIAEEVKKRNLKVDRENLRIVANEIRLQKGPGFIVERLYEDAEKIENNCVIESIRTPGEVKTLQEKDNFYLFAVDADPKIRYQRMKVRASEKDNVTFEEFLEAERKEMENKDPAKQNIQECIKLADYKMENNSTRKNLYIQVDKALKDILSRKNKNNP